MPRTPDLRQRSRWQLPATATTSTTTSATATALVPIFPYLSHLYEQNGKTHQLKVPIIPYLRQRSWWQLPATTSTTSATATARSPSHLLGAAAAPAHCTLPAPECICSNACTQQSDFPIQLSQYDTDTDTDCGYEMHCRTSVNGPKAYSQARSTMPCFWVRGSSVSLE